MDLTVTDRDRARDLADDYARMQATSRIGDGSEADAWWAFAAACKRALAAEAQLRACHLLLTEIAGTSGSGAVQKIQRKCRALLIEQGVRQ